MGKADILFIKQGRWSHSNEATRQALLREFPDHNLEVVDIAGELLDKRFTRILASLHVWRNYHSDLMSGRRTYRECIYRTRWAFDLIRRWIQKRLAPFAGSAAFTLQTQSLFDAGVDALTHFVFTDHTHLVNLSYPGFDPKMLFPEQWIELERTIYRRARVNFTMSQHVARSLVEQYGCAPARVQCVYAGSNAPVVEAPATLERFRRKRILFNGLFWERKGGPDLASAFRQVLIKHPDAHLTIIGCKPGLDIKNVTEKGRIPLDEVPQYYAQASVFCMPTRNEPFGIAVVEAMLHHLPVVTTRIGALPDMVVEGVNGHLVEPGDVKSLAQALERLLDSPETCVRMGEASRARALEHFTWEATGRKMAEGIRASLQG